MHFVAIAFSTVINEFLILTNKPIYMCIHIYFFILIVGKYDLQLELEVNYYECEKRMKIKI